MEPRTKKEKQIAQLREKLPLSLSRKQINWAERHIFSAGGFFSRKKAWCFDCGTIFAYNGKDKVVCPHCGRKITLQESGKWSHHEPVYYGVMCVVDGYQVLRSFVIDRQSRKGKPPVYVINECFQLWEGKEGRLYIFAKDRYGFNGWYYDKWNYESNMTLKPHSYLCYEFGGYIYPHSGIASWLRKIGFNINLYRKASCCYNDMVTSLLGSNQIECLAKVGQYELFSHYVKYGKVEHYDSAIVCNRHGYHISDASIWIDYMDLLEYFHLDTHNPKYICPQDLRAEHDRLFAKKEKIERRLELERKMKEAVKNEAAYKEAKERFFGIAFGSKTIKIAVICSVAEMVVEGEMMHHCVGGYWNKTDSLILSAKDNEGNRLETIEVSLKTFNVLQSRGVCNQSSPEHENILELMKRNMYRIKEAV